MANSYTLAGTAKARGLGQVDPRLVQIIEAAAARSPYQVQIFSGKRAGSVGGSRHNSGNALDIALIDPATGQAIPNYKSSTGFPIYAEFAKIAREEQMRLAPDMADQFRWGGGFSDKGFDLMHFDFKPGGAMRYWTWEDGGKLTAAGAEAVPKFGAGWVYANGEKQRAPDGQYASLWGRDPLQAAPAIAPQDAQSAIASLTNPAGGTLVPEMPSPLAFAAAEPTAVSGAAPQDAMLGGNMPPMPSAMDQGVGILPPIPTRRPGGAPSPDMLGAGPNLRPASLSPVRPSMPNTTDQSAGYLPPIPQMRPGGAPDASLVPTPPSRALGIPNPPMRPSMQIGPGTASVGAGMGAEAFGPQIGINQPPSAGGESYTPFVSQPSPYDDWTRAFDIPGPFTRAQEMRDANPWPEPWSPTVAGRPEFPGNLAAANPPDFALANPDPQLPPSWSPATSFPPPPAPVGTVGAGSTGGEFFTPGGWPEAQPDPFASRFNDAFSASAPSQVMDLQTAFDRRNAPPMISPPTMTAQDGITAAFGAPLARAEPPPPNLAIPFAEVPGFDMGRFGNMAPAPPSITMGDFDQRFASGSVVAPPAPGTPGVVQGTMPAPVEAGPIDIRSQAQGGPAYTPPMPGPPSPPTSPRMPNPGAERQRAGIGARVLGGIFGGPIGALGGGLFGSGGGGLGFGAPASFAWSGGGSAPYGNGGSTTYQKGTSNALGGSNALSWTGSKGQTVTVVQDPFTGTYMTAF